MYLEGIILKKPEFLGPSRDALNICAVTKGGTVLSQVQYEINIYFYKENDCNLYFCLHPKKSSHNKTVRKMQHEGGPITGFSKAPDTRHRSPATFSICAGYFLYSTGLDKNLNSSLPFGQASHRICLPKPISHLPVLKKNSHAH